ncbi:MAG TPA: hypothetical protein VH761_17520 [Ilumatobacteraceae bacterium]|jgi:hypothetical protein
MSIELEDAVRDVLRRATSHVIGSPDERDVARRVTRRVRRRRTAVGAAACLAAAGLVGGLALVGRDDEEKSVASEPVASTDPPMCEPASLVPFRPTVMIAGWTLPDEQWRLVSDAHVAVWSGPGGIIEIWNGIRDDLPVPGRADRMITVLGHQARLGMISDGYSVVVDLGATRCERWAIVAHPGVTENELAAVAEGLEMVD